MKYIDRILKIAKEHQSFSEFKREIERRIKNSDVSLERIWVGSTAYYVPCVAIGRRKWMGLEIPKRMFRVWFYGDRVKIIDLNTREFREEPL